MTYHTPTELRKTATTLSQAAYRTNNRAIRSDLHTGSDALREAAREIERLRQFHTFPKILTQPKAPNKNQ